MSGQGAEEPDLQSLQAIEALSMLGQQVVAPPPSRARQAPSSDPIASNIDNTYFQHKRPRYNDASSAFHTASANEPTVFNSSQPNPSGTSRPPIHTLNTLSPLNAPLGTATGAKRVDALPVDLRGAGRVPGQFVPSLRTGRVIRPPVVANSDSLLPMETGDMYAGQNVAVSRYDIIAGKFRCNVDGCMRLFTRKGNWQNHVRMAHTSAGDQRLQEVVGMDASPAIDSADDVVDHRSLSDASRSTAAAASAPMTTFVVSAVTEAFKAQRLLQMVKGKFQCLVDDCGRQFRREGNWRNHAMLTHRDAWARITEYTGPDSMVSTSTSNTSMQSEASASETTFASYADGSAELDDSGQQRRQSMRARKNRSNALYSLVGDEYQCNVGSCDRHFVRLGNWQNHCAIAHPHVPLPPPQELQRVSSSEETLTDRSATSTRSSSYGMQHSPLSQSATTATAAAMSHAHNPFAVPTHTPGFHAEATPTSSGNRLPSLHELDSLSKSAPSVLRAPPPFSSSSSLQPPPSGAKVGGTGNLLRYPPSNITRRSAPLWQGQGQTHGSVPSVTNSSSTSGSSFIPSSSSSSSGASSRVSSRVSRVNADPPSSSTRTFTVPANVNNVNKLRPLRGFAELTGSLHQARRLPKPQ